MKFNLDILKRATACFVGRAIELFGLLLLASCQSELDPDALPYASVELLCEIPESIGNAGPAAYRNIEVICRNVSSGETSLFSDSFSFSLLPGLYDIELSAIATDVDGQECELKGSLRSVVVGRNGGRLSMRLFRALLSDDLIISEIFFAGTLQSSGNSYTGDDYIKLYNNTDHVIYADGLTLFETKFTTTEKRVYTPDIMNEAVTVQALYTVPGSGKDHPVRPGEYLLLADTGMNHRLSNPNSFDLSHADFEWYDVSSSPSNLDIDTPVENLDKWYCYTLSYWILHNRGFKGYGIARIPIPKEEYLKDYLYEYEYILDTVAGSFPMASSAYRVPNEWIVDMVNCSIEAGFAWILCAPELDMGWTHCGTIDHDKNRYFKSVRRKLSHFAEDGRPVFLDTNNSTRDFNADVIPSEIELQASSIDRYGNRTSVVTYDGIVPVSL